MVKIARKINEIKLVTSVRGVKETVLEYTAGFALEWIKGVGNRGGGEVRRIVCQEICGVVEGEWCDGIEAVLWNDFRDALKVPESTNDGMVIDGESIAKLRLDQLLGLDIKLWKQARSDLKALLINSMIVDGDLYKRYLGTRFAFNYLEIVDAYLNVDKEYELSVSEFAVQLFTVPSISEYLIANTPLFKVMCTVMKLFYLEKAEGESFFPIERFLDVMEMSSSHYPKLNCDSDAFKSKRSFMVPNTLRYLVSR